MIHSWQMDLLDKMTKGKGLVQVTGRNTNKSVTQAYHRLWNDIMSSAEVSDIRLSEGTVYGSCYYTAEPIGGNWIEMEAWCYQAFGNDAYPIWGEKTAPKPAQRWYKNNRKFWFRSEADRTMFVLKWR